MYTELIREVMLKKIELVRGIIEVAIGWVRQRVKIGNFWYRRVRPTHNPFLSIIVTLIIHKLGNF